jgi:1-acyl-sn-glycerol-3-phosphate acyltransferase
MIFLRSLIFNLILFGVTAVMCIVMLPTLILPRRVFIAVVHAWLWMILIAERSVAGIRYKVVGRAHLPKGACIIAAKHQSAWETFKLHLLFGDPAIVLKKELLNIPVWGWYLRKSGVIPIDRAGRAQALNAMMRAAHRAADAGRKLVIFPQGTRIRLGDIKPYKSGVAALYKELGLPVVPMALNSGLFWPKRSFLKKPGLITIEFLPPIPPGLPRAELMTRLEKELEGTTDILIRHAREGGHPSLK